MKKIVSVFLMTLMVITLFSCTAKTGNGDGSEAETTTPITGPEGFEDVTAPETEDTKAQSEENTVAETTSPEETTNAKTGLGSYEDAMDTARKWLGETDPDTGYKYAYSYDGIQKDGERSFHRVRVSWYIEEEDRYSLCGYLLVDENGNVSKYSW